MPSVTESGFTAENHSHRGKTTGETIDVNHEHVCESKHITRRCALSVEFSDEDNKDAELHFLKDPGIPGSIKYGKMKLKSGKKYEDSDYVEEDPTSSDELISEWKKPKRESVDLLVQRGNHTCSVDSLKDVLSGSAASIADISDALVPMVSKSEKFIYFILFLHIDAILAVLSFLVFVCVNSNCDCYLDKRLSIFCVCAYCF